MGKIRIDERGNIVKKKPEIFKRKGKVTPHKTHKRVQKKKQRPSGGGIPRVEDALRRGGYY